MKRFILLIIAFLLSFKSYSQYPINIFKDGLKGNISCLTTTLYPVYSKESVQRDVVVFNRQGNILRHIKYDITQKEEFSTMYNYDNNKRLLSFYESSNGKITYKLYYRYNETGQMVLQQAYSYPESRFRPSKYIFKYDKNGQLTAMYRDEYGIDIRPSKDVYTYNSQGLKILGQTYNQYKHLQHIVAMAYNKQGDMIQLVRILPDEANVRKESRDTIRYVYSDYDKAGNWRKKKEIHIRGGEIIPGDVTMRLITYFKDSDVSRRKGR